VVLLALGLNEPAALAPRLARAPADRRTGRGAGVTAALSRRRSPGRDRRRFNPGHYRFLSTSPTLPPGTDSESRRQGSRSRSIRPGLASVTVTVTVQLPAGPGQ
jgi:hypothetical protein